MSDLSPLCAQERTSQKGETLSPLRQAKPDKSKFRAVRAFYQPSKRTSLPQGFEVRQS